MGFGQNSAENKDKLVSNEWVVSSGLLNKELYLIQAKEKDKNLDQFGPTKIINFQADGKVSLKSYGYYGCGTAAAADYSLTKGNWRIEGEFIKLEMILENFTEQKHISLLYEIIRKDENNLILKVVR